MLKESMNKSALVKDKSEIPRGCQHVYSKMCFSHIVFKANKAIFIFERDRKRKRNTFL